MTRGDTTEPLVVYATDTPGLVAADEILGDRIDRVVFCRAAELEAFPGYKDDQTFRVHCELHSYFEGPGNVGDAARVLADHQPGLHEELWLHHECSVMGPLYARASQHVWFWDGSAARLVQEGWRSWVS